MPNSEQYPFKTSEVALGEAGFRPYIPLGLVRQQQTITVSGLLDTGATVNVLPYQLGIELGYLWDNQTRVISLTGNLAQYETRVLVARVTIGEFDPVQLVFAWTRATEVPVILGQVNFFMEFDVCFYRSQLCFEVRRKST